MDTNIDVKLAILRQMVKQANGQITPDIIKIVEEITSSKSNSSFSSVSNAINLINQGVDPQKIIDSILSVPQPSIVSSMTKNIFLNFLSPIKMSFSNEIPKYISSVSIEKTISRTVPRMFTKSSLQTIKDGKLVPFVNSGNDSSDTEEYYINPEFKQLLLNGYRPADDKKYQKFSKEKLNADNPLPFLLPLTNEELRIGTPESEYLKNFKGEFIDNPIPKEKINVKIIEQAGLIKEAIANIKASNSQQPYGIKIDLSGQSISAPALSSMVPHNINLRNQSWNVDYVENKNSNTFILTVNKDSASSLNYGSSSVRFVGELNAGSNESSPQEGSSDSGLSQAALDKLAQLSIEREECDVQSNDELAAALFLDKLGNIFEQAIDAEAENGQRLKTQEIESFKRLIKENFNNINSSFVSDTFSSLNNSRMLKKFDPTAGFNLNSLDEDPDSRNSLTILGILKFLPETSEELKLCGKNIHPLNIDEVVSLMEKRFNEIGTRPKETYLSEDNELNPIIESVSIGVSLLIIRLFAFQYLLKNLVIFDTFKYNPKLIQSQITKEYLSLEIKKKLENLKIYRRVEKTINENYDFLKSNNIIKEEDETITTISVSSLVNGEEFKPCSEKFKNLVSAMLRKSCGYIKNLLGVTNTSESSTEQSLLSPKNSKVYDVFSRNNNDMNDNTKFKNCDINRFSDRYKNKSTFEEEERQFFINERMIHFEGFNREIFKTQQGHDKFNTKLKQNGLLGITSFQEFSCFINDFFKDSTILDDQSEAISNFVNINFFSAIQNRQIETIFSVPKIKIRTILVTKEEKYDYDEIVPSLYDDNKNKLRISNSSNASSFKKVLKNRILLDRSYCYFDLEEERKRIRFYNCLIVDEVEKHLNSYEVLGLFRSVPVPASNMISSMHDTRSKSVLWKDTPKKADLRSAPTILTNSYNIIFNNLEKYFNSIKEETFSRLNSNPNYELLTKKSMLIDKVVNLISFYMDAALSNKQTETLFEGTSKRMKDLLISIQKFDYEEPRQQFEDRHRRDIENIGNPNQDNPDILWFILTTPILIFKGVAQIMDPNIGIASKIVDAALAGLLFPKVEIDPQTNSPKIVDPVQYPGDPLIIPTVLVSLALLPINLFAPLIGPAAIGPPITPIGMVWWALEPILWSWPFFQKAASESSAAQILSSSPEYGNIIIGKTMAPFFTCEKDQDEN